MAPSSFIGLDLGGTKVLGVVVRDDRVTAEAKRKTPSDAGPDAVVASMAELVAELGGVDGVAAIGVGAPGQVDTSAGVVRRAPNLAGWTEVPLASLLSDALGGIDVLLDNDVNVAALAEQREEGVADMLAVFVGTGVGGGLVLDGEVRRGASGLAGEIGHVVVRPGGRECGCGGRGHLEAYAGRAGLEREARARATRGTHTALVELAGDKRMTAGVFAKAVEAGDALTMELLDDAVATLGQALSAAVTILDLPVVVVGGGLADKLGATFVGRIEQAVRDLVFSPAAPLRVVPARLGDRAGAVGAALLAARR